MFEKEAEDNKPPYACCSFNTGCELWKDGFQKGAEVGYNKANEWHYPSKNELPNCDDKTLLIFIANDYYEINGETIIKKRTVLGFYKKAFINDNVKLFVEKSKGHEEEHLPQAVIAWKEIVLPKESEIESEMFPEITLPKGSAEFVDKVIADAEKKLKESE